MTSTEISISRFELGTLNGIKPGIDYFLQQAINSTLEELVQVLPSDHQDMSLYIAFLGIDIVGILFSTRRFLKAVLEGQLNFQDYIIEGISLLPDMCDAGKSDITQRLHHAFSADAVGIATSSKLSNTRARRIVSPAVIGNGTQPLYELATQLGYRFDGDKLYHSVQ